MSQPENLQELSCGSVKERPAEFVGSACNSHQIPFDELSQHLARLHSAYGFDFRSQNRLAIGHDGQRLHGR